MLTHKSREWMKENLFGGPLNSIITITVLSLSLVTAWNFFNWSVLDANFAGETREDCNLQGACWVFVKEQLGQFMYGFYPSESRWRVNLSFVVLMATIGSWFVKPLSKKFLSLWSFLVFPIWTWYFLKGGFIGLESIETSLWGGVFLTILISAVGITLSLPLGIMLALGRRSQYPVIKSCSVLFIELWRGIPLITVLFMSSVMLPLFLPPGTTFDKLLRALIGVTLFSAAYMAEVIRGGLQAIPRGQFEASDSLGLSYAQSMRLVVLPQALKLVIPGIVNTFIGLYKDTTLVAIIGMFDVLGIIQAAVTDPEWLGYSVEGYLFAAFFYWASCYGMSQYSRHIENKNKVHT